MNVSPLTTCDEILYIISAGGKASHTFIISLVLHLFSARNVLQLLYHVPVWDVSNVPYRVVCEQNFEMNERLKNEMMKKVAFIVSWLPISLAVVSSTVRYEFEMVSQCLHQRRSEWYCWKHIALLKHDYTFYDYELA